MLIGCWYKVPAIEWWRKVQQPVRNNIRSIYAFRHHSSVDNDRSARLTGTLQIDLKKIYIPTAIICFGKMLVGEVKPSQLQLSPSKTLVSSRVNWGIFEEKYYLIILPLSVSLEREWENNLVAAAYKMLIRNLLFQGLNISSFKPQSLLIDWGCAEWNMSKRVFSLEIWSLLSNLWLYVSPPKINPSIWFLLTAFKFDGHCGCHW